MGEVIPLPGRAEDRQAMASDGKFPPDRPDLGYIQSKIALFAKNRASRGEGAPNREYLNDVRRLLKLTVRDFSEVSIRQGYLRFTTTGSRGDFEYRIKLQGAWWL